MNIDTPDNNPQRPQHNTDGPEIPKGLASEIVPKNSFLNQEVLDFLAAQGVDVSPKGLAYIFMGTQHERFQLGSIANIRVSEHEGNAVLIFHYKETENSDWETVIIVFPGLSKHQVYLLAQAISSGRVQAIVFGELERYRPEYSYRSFPPFAKTSAINYPARIEELQDLLEKCKAARLREANARKKEPTTGPATVVTTRTAEMQDIRKAYERERVWKILLGFLLGVLFTVTALHFGMAL